MDKPKKKQHFEMFFFLNLLFENAVSDTLCMETNGLKISQNENADKEQ